MGKGSCGDTKIKKETERDPNLASHVSGHDSEHSVQNDSNDQNANLIEYQERIEKDPRNRSITKNVLTKTMAIDMVNIRTEKGEGLGNCVYVNVKNPNCRFPYAVSADCYNIFADFFAEVIEEVHGDPQNEALLIPQFGEMEFIQNVDLNSYNRRRARAMYTEIIVRRNIQDIPFTPIIKKGDRQKVISLIEDKVRELLKTSEEEAFVPSTWDERMDEIKNDLDECGTMRDYPNGRLTLVFKDSKDIYEGCILNFDDHVQYVVSTNDGRIGILLKKMYIFLSDESMTSINYVAHPIFGHLTLSPAHVGTGMTIRVLVKLPFVSRLADVNRQIEEYDCVTVNADPHETSGILSLTNIKTLNTTEEAIFDNIIQAFNKLSQLEDELEATTAMAVQDDCMSAEDLGTLVKRITESQSVSYTKKYLTESMVLQYTGEKTNFKSTFNNCIRHNAYFPRSLFPRACDSNCYMKFSRFFDPILLESNGVKSFNHSKRPTYGSTVGEKRYQLRHPNIVSYRVRFSRNFEKFPFPMMMSSKDRADVERLVVKCFEELPVELEGDYCPIKSIKDSIYYEDILSYRLIPDPCDVDISAGFYRDWPKNRGIFIAKKHKSYPNIILLILINVLDHIKVVAIDPTGKGLNVCYERAVCMMKHLDLKFENKYSKKSGYGYLTSVPCFVGCALRVSALVKLKNLGEKREVLENECIGFQFVYRGTKGHGTIAEGNIFDISLKNNLNVTEQYIIMVFVQKLKELINIERTYDTKIPKPTNDDESEDDSYVSDKGMNKSQDSRVTEGERSIQSTNTSTKEDRKKLQSTGNT